MLPIDKDTKLSQLFQLKKNVEQPSREFWECFDAQLRQKFLAQTAKVSLWVRWCAIIQKWKVSMWPLTCATTMCCALFLGVIQFHSPKIEAPQASYASLPLTDIIPFSKTWIDVTLALDCPSTQHIHYIRDNIHTSRLNSKTKELVF
ncbi:MAG: hypothetical protein LBB05_02290 [Puniceicoccales bacterium]|jgi:hypothetical protein|nr:hypothetical protein [Puniceicoccales bacterium]